MKKAKLVLLLAVIAGLLWTQRLAILDTADSFHIPCEEKIHTALTKQQKSITLAGYRLSEEELKDIWSHVFFSNADLFFVDDQYEYTLLHDTVLSVTPRYTLSPAQLQETRTAYEKALEDILQTVNPAWTDLQKALYLHDYLCTHYQYDENQSRYTAPELLLEGTGVCQAYTLVYAALLNALEIDCSYIVSHDMNHTWNVVTLQGKQYHVDVTHDDPTCDRLGQASHNLFLVSDAALPTDYRLGADEGRGLCKDTAYDDAFWQDATSGFVPLQDLFYFIKDGRIWSWDGETTKQVFTIRSTWFSDKGDGSYWKGTYSALWPAEDSLLYNTNYRIMALNPATGTTKTVYTYSGEGSIFGFTYIDGVLTLQISDSPNELGEYITVTL